MRLDQALTVKMEALKSGALRALEQAVGRPVTYGEISPSFFRSINVRDVAIHDAADPGRTLLSIHQVSVYYSLLGLLFGRDPVGAIREIRLLNSRFAIDLERDVDVVDLVKRLLESGGGPGLRAKITGADIGLYSRLAGLHAGPPAPLFPGPGAVTGHRAFPCAATLQGGFPAASHLPPPCGRRERWTAALRAPT